MVMKVYNLISQDEDERFSDVPILVNVHHVQQRKRTLGQILEGVKHTSCSMVIVSFQSRINDAMQWVQVGDRLELNDCYYIIKDIECTPMNFKEKGKRKYIISV